MKTRMVYIPVAAAQPITGGMAPTIAPISVFKGVYFFKGVYTLVYRKKLRRPREAVKLLQPRYNTEAPAAPLIALTHTHT